MSSTKGPNKPRKDKTVAISRRTHERLQQLGYLGESYESVIVRALDSYESAHRLLEGQLAGRESP